MIDSGKWDVVVNSGSGLRVVWTSTSQDLAHRYADVLACAHPAWLVDVLPACIS